MTEQDLHTRIAAVIDEHPLCWDNGEGDWRCFCHADTVPGGWAQHVADAVIAELGLWKQWSNWHEGHYRYVTDWKADQ